MVGSLASAVGTLVFSEAGWLDTRILAAALTALGGFCALRPQRAAAHAAGTVGRTEASVAK